MYRNGVYLLIIIFMWSGDRIPVGREFPPVQTGPGANSASCKMGTGYFLGVKYGRGVLLTTHPPSSAAVVKSRAIPLPSLWATPGLVTGTLYPLIFLYFVTSLNFQTYEL